MILPIPGGDSSTLIVNTGAIVAISGNLISTATNTKGVWIWHLQLRINAAGVAALAAIEAWDGAAGVRLIVATDSVWVDRQGPIWLPPGIGLGYSNPTANNLYGMVNYKLVA